MFAVKIVRLYCCPICHKEYKRKGYYLKKHLKSCNAIAWIPKTRCEFEFKQIYEHQLSTALETMINGNFVAKTIDFWKVNKQPTIQIQEIGRGTISDYRKVMTELKQNISTLYI